MHRANTRSMTAKERASILPIALEGPDLCPVPEMLNSLQFDDVEVLIRSARRFADRADWDGPAVPD